jgi:type II restriction enzyme
MATPSLFGIEHSNRDFSERDAWGKNVFNSAFPVALCNYFLDRKIMANYLDVNKKGFGISEISIHDVYGGNSYSKLFFDFETDFTPHSNILKNSEKLSIDLVIKKNPELTPVLPLEVKLTTLPDNSTANLPDDKQSTELVIRTPTIGSLACSIATNSGNEIKEIFSSHGINDFSERNLKQNRTVIKSTLQQILSKCHINSKPLLLQPVWKTIGKSTILAENCLDVFIWSDMGLLHFILEQMKTEHGSKVTRQTRTAIWIFKMLHDFSRNGCLSLQETIDSLTFQTKNDKAFSSTDTHRFMKCEHLTKPRIMRSEIRSIILGGGEKMLSPERRFDGILQANSSELFK